MQIAIRLLGGICVSCVCACVCMCGPKGPYDGNTSQNKQRLCAGRSVCLGIWCETIKRHSRNIFPLTKQLHRWVDVHEKGWKSMRVGFVGRSVKTNKRIPKIAQTHIHGELKLLRMKVKSSIVWSIRVCTTVRSKLLHYYLGQTRR